MQLAEFTRGRDNNFNLIRIVAAFAVLVTHSFALAVGSGDAEPLRKSLGMTMGSIAVDVFFVTSGFLVTASLLKRQSAIEFVWARILRILPALLMMLILTVFGLGVFFTTWPLPRYFAEPKTYVYFLKCATLITGVVYELPGVFEANPYKSAINGSLWTLPKEVRMYAILAIGWVIFRVAKNYRLQAFELAIAAGAALAAVAVLWRHFYFQVESGFALLFYMFFSGAAFYVLKERVRLSPVVFWLFFGALLLAAVIGKHVFFVVYMFTVPYIVFYIAYVPSGSIRKYNQLGDYSYGVYIYAFPVQQSIAALIPGVSIVSMLAVATPVTILLAALSWYLIERRALSLKGSLVGHTRRALGQGVSDAPPKAQ